MRTARRVRLDALVRIHIRLSSAGTSGPQETVISLDLFNLLNNDTISNASATYSTWLAPQAVVAPRLMKVSLTLDF